jgi:hypothetical protein
MFKLRHNAVGSLRLALGMTTFALLAIFSTTVAFAADPSPGGSIVSGNMAATGVFSAGTNSITLNGQDRNAVEIGTLQLTANDFTGSGAGWNVTTSAPALTSGSHTLNTSLSTSSTSASALACAVTGASCSATDVSASTVSLDGSTQTLASASEPSGSTSYGMAPITSQMVSLWIFLPMRIPVPIA